MSNVRLFPVKYIPITKEAEQLLLEESYDRTWFYFPAAVVVSFLQLYPQKWSVQQLINLLFKNKKILISDTEEENVYYYDDKNLIEDIIDIATSQAFFEHLKENSMDRNLFKTYYESLICSDVYIDDVLKYIKSAYQVDFVESGIFELIKSLAQDGLLENITGVSQWLKKTSIKLQKQWKRPPLKTPTWPVKNLNGGQETSPITKKK